MARHATDIGRTGEFFAAYVLEMYGIEVHHVDRWGADLWCKAQGSIVTIQVKSCRAPRMQGRKYCYVYSTVNVKADWFCFVALDVERLLLRRGSEVVAMTTRIEKDEFSEENQRRTIEKLMNSC